MRLLCGVIAAGVVLMGFAGQGTAAPAGFAEQKLDGLTIEIPSSWKLAPKSALTEMEKKAQGMRILLMAEGDVADFPKVSVLRQKESPMSQRDFEQLDDNMIKAQCDQFSDPVIKQGGSEFVCKRVKAAKGSALSMQFTIAKAGIVNVSTIFFQDNARTLVTAVLKKADEASLLPQVEAVVQSVKLGK